MPFDGTRLDEPTIAHRMRALFRDGQGWGRGAFCRRRKDRPPRYCLLGALRLVCTGSLKIDVGELEQFRLTEAIRRHVRFTPSIGDPIISYNDTVAETYAADIAPVLDIMEALELADRAEQARQGTLAV